MHYKDYKVNGIRFAEQNGLVTCTIDQCGVEATYPLRDGNYGGKASFVMMDLDGTTVKSEEFWIWLIEKTVQRLLGKPQFTLSAEDIPFVSGFSTIEHLDYCIKKYAIPKTSLEANAAYHEIAERELNEILQGRGNIFAFQPRENLKEFLTELKGRGVKIGLATSGLEYKAIPEILSVFRLLKMGDPTDFYDAIVTGGKRKRQGLYGTLGEMAVKPHPWIYAELAMGLDVTDRSKTIVMEDSSAGLISGRLAGFDVLGFNDGNIRSSGMAEQTYAMIDTFEDALQRL